MHSLRRRAALLTVALPVLVPVVAGHARREDDSERLERDVGAGALDEARAFGFREEESGEDAQALRNGPKSVLLAGAACESDTDVPVQSC